MAKNTAAQSREWQATYQHGERLGSVNVHAGIDPSTPIYHYTRLRHLEYAVRNEVLWMRKASMWTDPCEAMWCDAVFRAANEDRPIKKQAFGHCWTRTSRLDALWRNCAERCDFSDDYLMPSNPGVRIKSTFGQLAAAFSRFVDQRTGKAYLGSVEYCSDSQLKDALRGLRKIPGRVLRSRQLATVMHFKRDAYRFEDEIRALWVETSSAANAIEMPCDMRALILQVMVGPTSDHTLAADALERVKALKLDRTEVKRSMLYDVSNW